MQRVIGLDIGSYSIKAVEIVNTFKSYEITNFYENVIPQIGEIDQDLLLPVCMEQLFLENKLEADRIITAMPGQYISSRIMTFNFSDPRKIATAVLAEVEDAVPFNLDDMIVDHQILGQMGGQTAALVVMTRKTFLKSFLDHLNRIDIDPKLVDVDSLAFYNLASYLDVMPGECVGLVDFGHEKTSVCIVQDGVLRMFRSINLGGRYFTEFLARDLETDFSNAQRVKHEVSQVLCVSDPGTGLDADNKMIAERMTLAANAIVKEVGRTLYAFKTWEKSPVTRIFISGGTTRIKNFSNYLEDQLEVPVKINRLDQTSLKISPSLADYQAIMPQGVAIGLRAVSSVKRHSQVNLRKGEFAYVQNYESILKGAGTSFKFVSVALAVLLVVYILQFISLNQGIERLQTQFINEYGALFPKDKKKLETKDNNFAKMRRDALKNMRTQIESKRAGIDSFLAANATSPGLMILKGLSINMPKEIKVDITQYQYDSLPNLAGRLVLRGETDSYPSVEQVVEALRKVEILKDVKERSSGPVPGTDNKVIEFVIEANYNSESDVGT